MSSLTPAETTILRLLKNVPGHYWPKEESWHGVTLNSLTEKDLIAGGDMVMQVFWHNAPVENITKKTVYKITNKGRKALSS